MSQVIAAVSTGNQISAIGILRLSGEGCAQVAEQVFFCKSGKPLSQAPNRKLVLGTLHDRKGRVIDQCMAVYTRGPSSYTGEDTVELHCHGSPAVLAAGLEALYLAGARPAKRGEFTKRAFLNGRMDLSQAEAVIDLIEAEAPDAAANAAGQVSGALKEKLLPIYSRLTDLCSHFHAVLDYPEEDIADFQLSEYAGSLEEDANALLALIRTYGQGQILRRGVTAVILGKPNVGKSSLLNALAGFDRVIVTDLPGTTRDTVEQAVMLGSLRVRLVDTAGIHLTEDTIEKMGIARSMEAVKSAELALFVCDGSQPLTQEDQAVLQVCQEAPRAVGLINKRDLGAVVTPAQLPFRHSIPISARSGEGLEELVRTVNGLFPGGNPCDGSILTNARQYSAIQRAFDALFTATRSLAEGLTPDVVLLDVEEAMEAIGEVTGATVREDITARIFERFCVGK